MALTRRFVDFPIIPAFGDRDPRHAADTGIDARLWLNIGTIVGSTPVDPTLMQKAVDLGATCFRFGSRWELIEDYDTGLITWPVGHLSALAWIRDNAPTVQVLCPVTYEPPWKQVDTLTLTATGNVGDTVLHVTSANGLANLIPRQDLVTVAGQTGPARTVGLRRGYAGGLIDSVDPVAGTVTLASAVATANDSKGNPQAYGPLTASSPTVQLVVNRQKWPAIGADNADPNGVSPQAFVRLVQKTADLIDSYGLTGWVELMNEPPWPSSPWASGINRYYDGVGDLNDGDQADPGMIPILRAALQMTGLSDRQRLCSGATHKGSRPDITSTVMAPYLVSDNVTDAKIRATITMQARHPYSQALPTTALWDPSVTKGNLDEALDSTSASNFNRMPVNAALFRAAGRPTPMISATEWGYAAVADSGGPNDLAQAKYTVSGVLARWGCGVIPGIYTLQTTGGYTLVNPDGSNRPAYTALKRLMTKVTGLGTGFNGAAVMPTVVGWSPTDTNRLTVVGVYGGTGACLFLFQHPQPVITQTAPVQKVADYSTVALPARSVPVALPFAADPAEVTVVSTGAAASFTRLGKLLTVQVTEDPVMIRVSL